MITSSTLWLEVKYKWSHLVGVSISTKKKVQSQIYTPSSYYGGTIENQNHKGLKVHQIALK